MNYITAEQFLEQPKEIQKVFLDWWQPQRGELYCDKEIGLNKILCVNGDDDYNISIADEIKSINEDCGIFKVPLFQIHQLKEFALENSIGYLKTESWKYVNKTVSVIEFKEFRCKSYDGEINALWQVACKIAEEIR